MQYVKQSTSQIIESVTYFTIKHPGLVQGNGLLSSTIGSSVVNKVFTSNGQIYIKSESKNLISTSG